MDKEKVVIVGVKLDKDKFDIETSLDELEELVLAAGGEISGRIIQRMDRINSAFYIGTGKVEEIKNFCEDQDISTVVFNDELSGAQIRNLEKAIGKKIVDRTSLILDIFAMRATSKEGKLQVKLAQLKYRLPRLIGFRDYLSREGGGIGTRGPGEQKLETDRRHILREVNNIEKEIKKSEEMREVTRKQRINSNLPIIALVGYTNAGKSTLMNKLTEKNKKMDEEIKDVFVKDMLFATLDTSLRKGRLNNGQNYILTDTVGFVSKLPTHLVDAFKGTLEELKYADLLLHVVDASNQDIDIQIETTMNIMKDLKVLDKPILTIFNKKDKIEDIENLIYNNKDVEEKIFISAYDDSDIDKLIEFIELNLPETYKYVSIKIPYDKQNIVSYFMDNYDISNLEHKEDGTYFNLNINSVDYKKYQEFILID